MSSIFPLKRRGKTAPPVAKAGVKAVVGRGQAPSTRGERRLRFHCRRSKAWIVPITYHIARNCNRIRFRNQRDLKNFIVGRIPVSRLRQLRTKNPLESEPHFSAWYYEHSRLAA